MYLFILLPVILYILIRKKSFKKVLRLHKVSPQQIFITMLLILAIQPMTALAARIMEHLLGHGFFPPMGDMSANGSGNLFMSLFIIAVTPAICEEVFMRGVVLDGYRHIPLWKTAIMNGVLFGLFHNNFMQLSYTSIVGIILTYVVVFTNSIYPAILMHFVMNALSVLMEKYPTSLYANFTIWYETNMVLLILLAIVSICATILLLIWLKRLSNNSAIESMDASDNSIEASDALNHTITFVEWPLMLATAISVIYSLMMVYAM
ncbi:CPBP family intramembrane metalloprotease [Vallitalea pronyensis]|uniref:CPBP family intramembrane metalloprotease n=1 Tax=Vallitalea pronyensis TaxID=1348613 RepID=A0A8J8MKJ4_9FIRM|nr:CPBP family intramembrane glutamic endopeptidase [Vallitalea pronyensis]QUI23137.1 CPBP family intramembrane metalloprotease [Vallitalea pronyensis]